MWDRDFLNKWDMARRIEARLFCFGSGDTDEGSGGGGSDNDSGGRQPGEGQVFGVDGVSKTGSTSRDAAIGFTDGSGGQGANYDALQNATSQQTTAAVAAANAAAAAGGDQRAQQTAVANILNSYDPSAVNQAGNLTQSGQDLVSQAANQAVAMQNTFGAGAGVAQALGMGPNAGRVTPAEEAAMNALVGNNVAASAAANAVAPVYNPAADMGFGFTPLPPSYQAPIDTIDNMLGTLAAMEERDRQRRAMFGGQTAADVQALNAEAGEVYYDETTGTYKAGRLPDTRPQDFANASALNNPTTTGFGPSNMASTIDLGPAINGAPRDISVASTNLPPAQITDMAGTTFDTTTGQIVPSMVDRYTGMDSDPMGRQYSNLLGNVQGALTDQDRFVNRRFRSAVDSSAIVDPNFDDSGKLLGFAANTGPFGSMVYTGMDNPNALPDTSDDADMVVAPLDNPMTNQPRCPDGYVFDDDLQACRLDVSGSSRQASTSDGDMFYRRTALDDAPANLPTGFDFDAANRRFTQSYGYRPDFYRSPMSLTGFTRLS